MRQEGELRETISAAKFRDDFFLHSCASQNPRLYHELYGDYDAPEEFEIPRTPEELNAMISELADIGVNLNVTDDVPQGPSHDDLERRFDVRPPQNSWNV
jgi:hypothetical protein